MTADRWRYDDALGWLLDPSDTGAIPIVRSSLAKHAAPRAANAVGIDVSKWQGASINWQQVAASGYSYCYVKATEGVGYISPTLDSQFNGATAAGLVTGCYHFASPSNAPEADADDFSEQVNRLNAVNGHLPPCLDLETGTGDLSNWASRFITRLRANTGCVRVMVYSSASMIRNQIREDWMDANVALWVGSWGTPPGQPSYLSPRVAIHQHTDKGQVSGISGNVDLNYALWPLNIIVPSATPPPPPTEAVPVNADPGQLTARQDGMLTTCQQQLSGSINPGEFPGWQAWKGGSLRQDGSPASLTLVDYSRQADVLLNTLMAKVTALDAKVSTAPTGGSLSDNDVQRVATAVVTMLAQRMAA
jgi:lysozyme